MKLAEAGVIAIVAGFALGILARHFLRSRVRLSYSEAALAGIVGGILGAGLANVLLGRPTSPHLVASAAGAVLGTVVVMFIIEWLASRRRWVNKPAIELIGEGESARVEFKSTARFNIHTGQRDERMENVIVKTVAAFLNGEGGCLLIGVTDDGEIRGLDDDYALMKAPDNDRYELWLRDYLGVCLGVVAARSVAVDFARVEAKDVCVVRVRPSPRPVFLLAPKVNRKVMIVRVGNSSRELEVDEALAYCASRWGRRTLKAAAG